MIPLIFIVFHYVHGGRDAFRTPSFLGLHSRNLSKSKTWLGHIGCGVQEKPASQLLHDVAALPKSVAEWILAEKCPSNINAGPESSIGSQEFKYEKITKSR